MNRNYRSVEQRGNDEEERPYSDIIAQNFPRLRKTIPSRQKEGLGKKMTN